MCCEAFSPRSCAILKLVFGVLSNVVIFGALLFLPTRDLAWRRAWIFLGVVLVGATATTAYLRRTSPAGLAARFKPPVQEGQPLADKIVVLLLIARSVPTSPSFRSTCSGFISCRDRARSRRPPGSSCSWSAGGS